jgi:hypothetical protein
MKSINDTFGNQNIQTDVYFSAGKTIGKDALVDHELTHAIQPVNKNRPNLTSSDLINRQEQHKPSDDAIREQLIFLNGLEINDMLGKVESLTSQERETLSVNSKQFRGEIHEERVLLAIAAVHLRSISTPKNFEKKYRSLLETIPPDQSRAILAYLKLNQGENLVKPAFPGDLVDVDGVAYLVVDNEVRVKARSNSSPSWRNNNPGNITVNSQFPEAWNYGAYSGKNTSGRFAIFPTYEAGVEGTQRWMEKRRSKTIQSYFEAYAPSSEQGNDPNRYAKNVASAIGFSVRDTINRVLDEGKFLDFISAQKREEGWAEGGVFALSDSSLPELVLTRIEAARKQKTIDDAVESVNKANRTGD